MFQEEEKERPTSHQFHRAIWGELVLLVPTILGSIGLEVLISKGDELALRGLVRILLKIEH